MKHLHDGCDGRNRPKSNWVDWEYVSTGKYDGDGFEHPNFDEDGNKATYEDRAMGADIADIIIRWALRRKAEVAPEEPVPPPEQLYADNPVMQEVMRYISPE